MATSGGVLVGFVLVPLTGWLWLDPALAALMAVNILWTGWGAGPGVGRWSDGRRPARGGAGSDRGRHLD
ncbi:hypothetical protein [Belnapia moabensis]|uniref:hypothetical protein n=1 Tax=Belnapia moabensis TaxID=365533 RepID=UPI001FE0145C|nr:hypothetical protein [Belnapia moabensis]